MNTIELPRMKPEPAPSLFEIWAWSTGGQIVRWGAIAAVAAAAFCGVGGVLLLLMSPLLNPLGPVVGNALLFSVIPLLLVGAHCLDRLERGLAPSKRTETHDKAQRRSVRPAARVF